MVVLNYKTGEVLSMVSMPDYDPYKAGTKDVTDTAYLNRCLQCKYIPGSVFKIVTMAAMLENWNGTEILGHTCGGSRVFDSVKVSCAGETVHGYLTLKEAFMKSCNVTFAAMSYVMGADAMYKTAESFAFNDNFKFQDLVLYESQYPSDISTLGDLAWASVGQGTVLVTPLHMAMITGSIANGGIMMQPTLISQVTGSTGIPRLRSNSGMYKRVVSASTAATIGEYMKATVNQSGGTGYRAALSGYTVCGKTGTAEVSNDKSAPTNAWFVGYVAESDHPYAVAVVIEQGGSGGDKAARLAGKALKKAIELIG